MKAGMAMRTRGRGVSQSYGCRDPGGERWGCGGQLKEACEFRTYYVSERQRNLVWDIVRTHMVALP